MAGVRHPVQLDPQFLASKRDSLRRGIHELIWNGFDADADHIDVRFERHEMADGIQAVVVIDDGHGMTLREATEAFVPFGFSEKGQQVVSRHKKRALHGKEGRGRFRLFRHGGRAEWRTVAEDDGGSRRAVRISFSAGDDALEIDDLGETSDAIGTTVRVFGFSTSPNSIDGSPAVQAALTTFALAIDEHDLRITYDDELLDPEEVRVSRVRLAIDVPDEPQPLALTIVQWNQNLRDHAMIYACPAEGRVVGRAPSEVGSPGIYLSGYLQWPGFADLAEPGMPEWDPAAAERIRAARDVMGTYAQRLSDGRRGEIIGQWRDAGVYPYKEKPTRPGDIATQQTFDLVAVEAAEEIN